MIYLFINWFKKLPLLLKVPVAIVLVVILGYPFASCSGTERVLDCRQDDGSACQEDINYYIDTTTCPDQNVYRVRGSHLVNASDRAALEALVANEPSLSQDDYEISQIGSTDYAAITATETADWQVLSTSFVSDERRLVGIWTYPAASAIDDIVETAGIPSWPNVVFFLNQGHFGIRPGAGWQSSSGDGYYPPAVSLTDPVNGSVVVLDTPPVAPSDRLLTAETMYSVDSKQVDVVDHFDDAYRGHGPVIADLIGDMLSRPEEDAARSDVILMPLLTDESIVGGLGVDDDGTIRGFDATALLASLDTTVINGVDPAVLNLSLSSEGCPALFGTDHPIRTWISDRATTTIVVAAAGNRSDEQPQYPAAWSPDLDNLVSVGALAVNDSGTADLACFTNRHDSIDVYLVGEQVELDHPIAGPVTWRGTSFAVPQAVALIAGGMDIQQLSGVAKPTDVAACPALSPPSP